MDIALSDNTMVALTDTYGAWYWNPSGAKPLPAGGTGVWEQLCAPSRFNGAEPASITPDGQESFTANGGVWAIRIANSNTSIFYMVYLGRLYKSTDKGTTWTRLSSFTAVSSSEVPGNGGSAQYGPHMAIDPINANRFVFGTATACYKSTDGSTVSTISTGSIPAATGGGAYGFVYDPRVAAQSGGNTQILYGFSDGNGLYKSSDAGSTWAIQNASGMPTTFRDVIVHPTTGDVYVVDGTSSLSNVKKYNGTTWSSVTATSTGVPFTTIAFDPTNGNKGIIFSQGANLIQVAVTSNGGTSFTSNVGGGVMVATDLPWLAVHHPGFNPGRCCYDNTGQVFLSDGVGIWTMATTPPSSGAFNIVSQTAGIEQLITNQIISPPGGNPIVASWDRAAFVILNPKSYPTTYFPGSQWTGLSQNEIIHGWGCDYASSDPTFVCVFTDQSVGGNNSPPFYSTNKGASWSFMAATPTQRQGGAIAASTPQNMVAVTSNNGSVYYTTNQGAAWTSLETYFNTNFSVPTIASGNTGWGNAYFDNFQPVCADRVAANTFYLYNKQNTANGGGIYRSTNSGAAWTRMNNNPAFVQIYGSLKSVPQLGLSTNTTGHLFFTGGQSSAAFGAHPSNQPLYRSTDGGTTWTNANTLIKEAYAVGFGANPGGSYPAVGFWGWYNGVGGFWVSKDNCATFTKIGELTLYGTSDYVTTVTGDSNTADIWYVGLHNSGSAYYGP